VSGTLERTGLAPALLKLEVTEASVMRNPESAVDKLARLCSSGVRLGIDDFGSGYASLSYLARLPAETVRIDRAFVVSMLDDPYRMTLVNNLVSLARSLRVKVVAEGVESEKQAHFLQLLHCDQMQGQLFSPPLTPQQAAERLSHPAAAR
jgi:EAL domain-containing protein (putative c-di-GMP-specific phosphodiesterase class I)